MKKYAMVPINGKEDEHGNPIIRRVLITYESSVQKNGLIIYKRTKFIDKDPYFDKPSRTTSYIFKDTYYTLDWIENLNSFLAGGLTGVKRRYHSYINSPDILKPSAIEFEAETVQEAKEKFHNRKELRD